MRHITGETRYEKCAEILGTHYQEDGVSGSTFHKRLKITPSTNHRIDSGSIARIVTTSLIASCSSHKAPVLRHSSEINPDQALDARFVAPTAS